MNNFNAIKIYIKNKHNQKNSFIYTIDLDLLEDFLSILIESLDDIEDYFFNFEFCNR